MKNAIAKMNKCLKLSDIPVTIKRSRGYYRAFMPSSISKDGGAEKLSGVDIAPGRFSRKIDLKLALAERYCASVFSHCDTVYIRPRYAMKCPRWGGRFAALPEVTHAAIRAGLIASP